MTSDILVACTICIRPNLASLSSTLSVFRTDAVAAVSTISLCESSTASLTREILLAHLPSSTRHPRGNCEPLELVRYAIEGFSLTAGLPASHAALRVVEFWAIQAVGASSLWLLMRPPGYNKLPKQAWAISSMASNSCFCSFFARFF